MTRASSDKFLEGLFSFPTAVVVILLAVGVRRIRELVNAVIERGFRVGGVEVPPAQTRPTEAPSPDQVSPGNEQESRDERLDITTPVRTY
jgi:hypothetical protein